MNKATNNMLKQGLLAMLVMLLSAGSALAQQSLFFSEYIEGGGNNKAFEIFNPTDDDIDLGNYIILGNYNGNPLMILQDFQWVQLSSLWKSMLLDIQMQLMK